MQWGSQRGLEWAAQWVSALELAWGSAWGSALVRVLEPARAQESVQDSALLSAPASGSPSAPALVQVSGLASAQAHKSSARQGLSSTCEGHWGTGGTHGSPFCLGIGQTGSADS